MVVGEAANLSHPRIFQTVCEGAQLKLPMPPAGAETLRFRGMPIGMPAVSLTGTYVRA